MELSREEFAAIADIITQYNKEQGIPPVPASRHAANATLYLEPTIVRLKRDAQVRAVKRIGVGKPSKGNRANERYMSGFGYAKNNVQNAKNELLYELGIKPERVKKGESKISDIFNDVHR